MRVLKRDVLAGQEKVENKLAHEAAVLAAMLQTHAERLRDFQWAREHLPPMAWVDQRFVRRHFWDYVEQCKKQAEAKSKAKRRRRK